MEKTAAFRRVFQIWLLLFLGMNLINWQDGGVNAASRFAAIQSMAEDHTFQIGHFQDWTDDWSRGPNGHVYSNKAPGPMFLATPFAWVLNRIKIATYGDAAWFTYANGDRKLCEPGLGYMTLISWLLQIVPFCGVIALALAWLRKRGASFEAVVFTILALLFGNTLSIFMNMFFGHPIAGWSLLALFLCLSRRSYFGAAFFFGLSLLCDYGTVFVALPFLAAVFVLESAKSGVEGAPKRSVPRILGELIVGGIVPGTLWVWYHTTCFGKPWALPMQFQNPKFVESSMDHAKIWGVAAPIPDWKIFLKLCFGMERGILFTQPWVWILAAGILGLFVQRRLTREVTAWAVLVFGGLFGLLWMNAGFNGWHGGGSAGPRYLSIIFPCAAVLGGLLYDQLSPVARKALWITLIYTVFFRILVYCTTPLADSEFSLWTYYLHFFFTKPHLPLRVVTFVATCGAFLWAGRATLALGEKVEVA
jgi:hypothetical protein